MGCFDLVNRGANEKKKKTKMEGQLEIYLQERHWGEGS